MKSFIIKIDDKLKISFNDSEDKAVFRRLLSSLKRNGHNKFLFNIEVLEKSITNKQLKLLDVIYGLVSKESGDSFRSVKESLIQRYEKEYNKSIDDFNNEDYNNYINDVISFCNDFFGLNVWFDDNGHVQVKKIK